MITKDLNKLTSAYSDIHGSGQQEASVLSFGSRSSLYNIKLRNGAQVKEVPGPLGLQISDSVTVLIARGRVNKYKIISEGRRSKQRETEVFV